MNAFEFLAALGLALAAGGGIGVAIINGINERRLQKLRHSEAREERHELDMDGRLDAIEKKVDALTESQKYVLYDRIRYLGQEYISAGEIDFDDRRILGDMHRSYHGGLGGNGDLDRLMEAVNKLPLKAKKI